MSFAFLAAFTALTVCIPALPARPNPFATAPTGIRYEPISNPAPSKDLPVTSFSPVNNPVVVGAKNPATLPKTDFLFFGS